MMVASLAAVKAFRAGGDAQGIQGARGEVAGSDIDGAVEEGEQAGQLGQPVLPLAVMEADLTAVPAAADSSKACTRDESDDTVWSTACHPWRCSFRP